MVRRSTTLLGLVLTLLLVSMSLWLAWSGGPSRAVVARELSAAETAIPLQKFDTPAPGALRFAVIGDFGSGTSNEAAVAELVKSWNPDFIVAVGDDRYGAGDYDAAVGQFYCGYLKDVGRGPNCPGGPSAVNRFFPALGNHDYSDGGGLAEYLSYFTLPGTGIPAGSRTGQERYYDFIQGPLHFFVIDSLGALVSQTEMAAEKKWLEAGLATSSTPWQLVLLHHAPYSSGTHGSTAAMQWPYQAWGADAVLAGHDHTYERLQIGAIPYFVNGLCGMSRYSFKKPVGGSQVRYNADYGAMLVTASNTDLMYEFVSRTGKVIDSYRQSRPTPSATTKSTSTATPSATSTPTRRHAVSATPMPAIAPSVTPAARLIPPYLPLLLHR
jgi:tartrate-resistant acid phosphatase type 5